MLDIEKGHDIEGNLVNTEKHHTKIAKSILRYLNFLNVAFQKILY